MEKKNDHRVFLTTISVQILALYAPLHTFTLYNLILQKLKLASSSLARRCVSFAPASFRFDVPSCFVFYCDFRLQTEMYAYKES